MSLGDKLTYAKTSYSWSPMVHAYQPAVAASGPRKRILQSKGFIGGVPLNTETTAVKPRVGSAS
jgi:hypothetical protein